MLKNKPYKNHHPACNLVPGFAYYEGIGIRLAEVLVDFFEGIADLIGRFRI